MRSVTIKAGRTLQWKVDVEGEPTPKIEWSWRDDIPLTQTESISIDNNTPNHTIFTFVNIKREDRGNYKLKYAFHFVTNEQYFKCCD
jgi:hypothetical protein